MRRAVVVAADRAGLSKAGEKLRQGGNVAFPTETVYGLGGNALDESAVLGIFEKKGRPLTDPLIVHVLDSASALELVEAKGVTKRIFELLAATFWPGPLTMVLKAAPQVPSTVCANTGFVGVRCPAHPVARQLLETSKVPVAAPSANRFGHVSPTSAQHVLDDLGAQDIIVVDGGSIANGACQVGIESTVLKVVDSDVDCDDEECERSLVLFRKGGVSESALRAALDKAGFSKVKIIAPQTPTRSKVATQQTHQEPEESFCAPGQAITHYAPDADTWLVQTTTCLLLGENIPAGSSVSIKVAEEEKEIPLGECAVVDFNGSLANLKPFVLAYRDVASDGSLQSAAQNLFDCLRWTETTSAKHVLIKDVSDVDNEHSASVADRMYRAASGKVAHSPSLTWHVDSQP